MIIREETAADYDAVCELVGEAFAHAGTLCRDMSRRKITGFSLRSISCPNIICAFA